MSLIYGAIHGCCHIANRSSGDRNEHADRGTEGAPLGKAQAASALETASDNGVIETAEEGLPEVFGQAAQRAH